MPSATKPQRVRADQNWDRLSWADYPHAPRSRELAVLHDEVNACYVCHTAPGFEKPPPLDRGGIAPVMIVGQGPGRAEVDSGRPFAGQAGRRLDEWLVQAGADPAAPRANVYLTSVIKCATSATGKVLSEMARNCSHFLNRQVRTVRPNVVITLGAVAFKRMGLINHKYRDALCRPVRTDELVLLTEFGFDFVYLPWPHPSGLNRYLNDRSVRAAVKESAEALRPYLSPKRHR